MALPRWKFVRPSDKSEWTWHPLTVGDDIDLQVQYGSPSLAPMKVHAGLAARLVPPGGDAGKAYSLEELRTWEQGDLIAFLEEVQRKEEERSAAYVEPADRASVIGALESAIREYEAQQLKALAALRVALASARSAHPPLGK